MSYNLVGQKFGHLTVLEQVPNPSKTHKERMYKCVCDCDNHTITTVRSDHLRSGRVVSCGCKRRTRLRSDIDRIILSRLKGMRSRCRNPNEPAFKHYGGRGIEITNDWTEDKEKFLEWAKTHGFRPDLTIERNDVNKGYTPDNCSWETMKKQANNKRTSHFLTVDGETLTITQWEQRFGLNKSTFFNLLAHHGEQAVINSIRRRLHG